MDLSTKSNDKNNADNDTSSEESNDEVNLHSVVSKFKYNQLQILLGFAGKSKMGRKTDLQSRALSLVHDCSQEIRAKVLEIEKNSEKTPTTSKKQKTNDLLVSSDDEEAFSISSSSSWSSSPSPPPRSVRKIQTPTTTPRRELRKSTLDNSKASTAAAIAASSVMAKEREKNKKSKESSKSKKSPKEKSKKDKHSSSSSKSKSNSKENERRRSTRKSTTGSAISSNDNQPQNLSVSSNNSNSVGTKQTTSSNLIVPRLPGLSPNLNASSPVGNFNRTVQPPVTSSIFLPSNISSPNSLPSCSSQQIGSIIRTVTHAQGMSFGYNYYEDKKSNLMYPTFPDVKLRKLPFYKILATLMQPCSLQPSGNARFQEQKFSFYLSPSQASEIAQSTYRDSHGRVDYKRQIQLRFSLLETSCEQDDNFPSSISVKINNKMQSLPNPIPTNKPCAEPKRPPKPINITSLCKLSSVHPNFIDVSWAVEFGKGFTVSVYYVDKLGASDLMSTLKERGTRLPDYTKALIKEKLNDKDSDISTTSCKVTLACPLGKMRMAHPCRASTCDHLQCFDASLYLMMNERKPKWLCPVCNKPAPFDSLLLDGFYKQILSDSRLPRDDHEIVLHNDGTWDPLPPKKDPESISTSSKRLSSDSKQQQSRKRERSSTPVNSENAKKSQVDNNASKKSKDSEIECVTLDSSDEEAPADSISTLNNLLNDIVKKTAANKSTQNAPEPTIICLDD